MDFNTSNITRDNKGKYYYYYYYYKRVNSLGRQNLKIELQNTWSKLIELKRELDNSTNQTRFSILLSAIDKGSK